MLLAIALLVGPPMELETMPENEREGKRCPESGRKRFELPERA
jgi:hypothetical protein